MKLVIAITSHLRGWTRCARRSRTPACTAWRSPERRVSADKKGHTELYRGAEYVVDFLPRIELETAVQAAALERVTPWCGPGAPARSATAGSSSSISRRACAWEPARPARPRS